MASISEKVGDLGDYLREQRQAARLSVRQLSLLAGVSNPYLSQIERGLRKPSAEVLQQLAKGLRISAEALYVRAGILDGESRPDVEIAIASDPTLTDRQRRALHDIYASFRAENARGEAVPTPAATVPRGGGRAASRTAGRVVSRSTVKKGAAKKGTVKKAVVKGTVKKSVVKAATRPAAVKQAAVDKAVAKKAAVKKATAAKRDVVTKKAVATKAAAGKPVRRARARVTPSQQN